MTLFIFSGIVLSIAGGFFGLIFTSGIKNKILKIIVAIFISLAFGFGVTILMFVEHKQDEKLWNNGQCSECGGEYNLIDIEHHRNSGNSYYYECNDCGRLIETNSHFHKKRVDKI